MYRSPPRRELTLAAALLLSALRASAGPVASVPERVAFVELGAPAQGVVADRMRSFVQQAVQLRAGMPTLGATPGALAPDAALALILDKAASADSADRAAAHAILTSLRAPAQALPRTTAALGKLELAERPARGREAAASLTTFVRDFHADASARAALESAAVSDALESFDGGHANNRLAESGSFLNTPYERPTRSLARLIAWRPGTRSTVSAAAAPAIERLAPPQTATPKVSTRKMVAAGVIGNIIEWYDFGLYGFLGPVLAQLFFPARDAATALLATFGVFAAGFLMRPVGAFVFGYVGHKLGRKRALAASVILMAVPTAFIGLLPTYAAVGLAAPLLLTAIRLIQGLSAGGEFTSSAAWMVEHAAPTQRGFIASWTPFSAVVGMLIGSLVATIVVSAFTPHALLAWAWRLPFLLSIVGGLVGRYLRTRMEESPLFERMKEEEKADANASFLASLGAFGRELRSSARKILLAASLNLASAAAFYLLFVYMTTYLQKVVHLAAPLALGANTASMALLAALMPVMGALSDKIGRKPVLLFGALGLAAAALPIFLLAGHATLGGALAAQALAAVFASATAAVMPATLIELFSTKERAGGFALGHNLSTALFGGGAPLIATYLIQRTGSPLAPAYYLMALAVGTIAALATIPESSRKPLE